jgi:hypothetical protein
MNHCDDGGSSASETSVYFNEIARSYIQKAVIFVLAPENLDESPW